MTLVARARDRTHEKRLSLSIRCLTSGPAKSSFHLPRIRGTKSAREVGKIDNKITAR